MSFITRRARPSGRKNAMTMEQARNACHLLHCRLSAVQLQRAYGARSLVIAEKIAPTPKTYPRRAGLPAKKPL